MSRAKDQVQIVCQGCGATFERPRSHAHYKHCSTACRDDFWRRVDKGGPNGCWLWTGGDDGRGGYGKLQIAGKARLAHRVAFEMAKGPVPDGRELDHLCGVKRCVNPDHLEPVTHSENLCRSLRVKAARTATHCKRGHEWTPANTLNWSAGRQCRQCRIDQRSPKGARA